MRTRDIFHLEAIYLVYMKVLDLIPSIVGFGVCLGEQTWKEWQINEGKFDKKLDIILILKDNNIGKFWYLVPF